MWSGGRGVRCGGRGSRQRSSRMRGRAKSIYNMNSCITSYADTGTQPSSPQSSALHLHASDLMYSGVPHIVDVVYSLVLFLFLLFAIFHCGVVLISLLLIVRIPMYT